MSVKIAASRMDTLYGRGGDLFAWLAVVVLAMAAGAAARAGLRGGQTYMRFPGVD